MSLIEIKLEDKIMLEEYKKMKREKIAKFVFVIFVFLIYFIWACSQPYNAAPDEGMKYDICKYIVENNKLPHGGDEAIRSPIWGISYGFTPILAYMISSVFMRIVMLFTTNEFAILVGARFTSVLFGTLTVWMAMKIGEKLFQGMYRWLFVVLIACLPQFAFLGSYLNNDSLALFSISVIIYAWLIGKEQKWNLKSCILLSVRNRNLCFVLL